jgi:hypothetical protein
VQLIQSLAALDQPRAFGGMGYWLIAAALLLLLLLLVWSLSLRNLHIDYAMLTVEFFPSTHH